MLWRSYRGTGADPNTTDERDRTSLMRMSGARRYDAMRLLLRKGAKVNATDNKGMTAIIWASGDPTSIRILKE